MKLVLLRHGESQWNLENRFTGWTDVPLSAKGVEEARQAGVLLRQGGFDFDVCYTSYLKRAIQTLNLALEQMDREWLPVLKSWALNERHYGALQGLNKSETAEKYGEAQVKIWRRSFDVRPPLLEESDPRKPRAAGAIPRRFERAPPARREPCGYHRADDSVFRGGDPPAHARGRTCIDCGARELPARAGDASRTPYAGGDHGSEPTDRRAAGLYAGG